MTEPMIKYAIVEYTTRRNFLNLYNAIEIEKIEIEVVSYDKEKRIHLDRAAGYLPIMKAKLLVHHVLSGIAQQPGWKMELFGGSFRDDGIESRLINIEYDPGADGKFAKFPFRISLAIGPGKRTATGGIAPDGKPTTQISMRLPDDDFTGICLELRDFLLVHQRDLEAIRVRDQQKRYAERRSS